MKRYFFLITILLISTACSKIEKRSEIVVDDQELIGIYTLLDNWKLDEAEVKLLNSKIAQEKKTELQQKITLKKENESDYKMILIRIKEALNQNNFAVIESYLAPTVLNNIKFRELKKNDYSNLKIYFGKSKFFKEAAETLMLVNYSEETFYIDLQFRLKEEKKWELVSFKERG